MAEVPNIKPNSSKYRTEKKKEEEYRLEKKTKGEVNKKQETSVQKFAKAFIPEDKKSIKDYIVEETPGLIMGFLRRFLQSMLDAYLPDKGGYSRGSAFGMRNGRTDYTNVIRTGASTGAAMKARNTNTVYEYENVIFKNYADAKDVLDGLYECLSLYEKVRVLDLYDLAGIASNATDRNYGWVDLRGSRIIAIPGEGYIIDLPKAIPLT